MQTYNGNLVNQGGTLAPGESAGSTAIVGDYTQQAGAALEIEIGGPLVNTEYDVVNVTGNAFLGGELELALIEDYVPPAGQTFTVLSAGNLLNFFSNVTDNQRLVTVDGLGSFLVRYGPASPNPNQIVLSDFQSSLTADFDHDSDVHGRDFLVWQRGGSPNPLSTSDLALWQSQYGSNLPIIATKTSVPEPTSWVLELGLLFICLARQKARS